MGSFVRRWRLGMISCSVIVGLDPTIQFWPLRSWMLGSSPSMTVVNVSVWVEAPGQARGLGFMILRSAQSLITAATYAVVTMRPHIGQDFPAAAAFVAVCQRRNHANTCRVGQAERIRRAFAGLDRNA